MGCHFILQRIFPIWRLNPSLLHLLHWQADSLPLHHLGNPSGFKVSRIRALEPHLRRAFFNQKRVDSIARSLELWHIRKIDRIKDVLGSREDWVGEQKRTVFRCWGLTARRLRLLLSLQGTELGPEVTGYRIFESSIRSRLLMVRVQKWNGLLRRTAVASLKVAPRVMR